MSGLICELCWRSSVVFPSGSILADPESAMLFARWCDHLEIVNIFVVVIIGLAKYFFYHIHAGKILKKVRPACEISPRPNVISRS